MKNALLLFFSILLALFLGEIIIRYLGYWTPLSLCRAVEYSERGYWVNPNNGVDYPQPQLNHIQYHFYPPHLRGTPINHQARSIIVLGDSFTFGWLLSDNQLFIHHLQIAADKKFGKSKYQFLNAASGGWGTADYLAYLEEFGNKISPKIVIVFMNTDDIARSLQRNIYKLANSKSLQLKENFHPLPHIKIKKALRYSSCWLITKSELAYFLYDKLSTIYSQFSSQKSAFIQDVEHPIPMSPDMLFEDKFVERYGKALFHRMNSWCKQHHATLLVITTGFNAFYPSNIHDPTKTFLSKAPSFFANEGIPYFDMATLFQEEIKGKNIQIPLDQHPNTLGAYEIAKISWPWIREQINASN